MLWFVIGLLVGWFLFPKPAWAETLLRPVFDWVKSLFTR